MTRRTPLRLVALALLGLALASACGGSSKPSAALLSTTTTTPNGSAPTGAIEPGASYHPTIDPRNFRGVVDNPWFPLKPGSIYVYTGVKDGKRSRDIYTVTHTTKIIDGAPCVVVSDQLSEAGRLSESTTDYYTQDVEGNVWYFGEATAELDPDGRVTSTEGSWLAGHDGAQPGIFMEADPVIGHAYRQEYYAGNAEDQYSVVSLASSIKVPYGTFTNALLTKETTRLEPGGLDHKYYVKHVGEVAEITVDGPLERGLLESYRPG